MSKYVCPLCKNDLTCTSTKDWCVDPETGILDCPTIDNYFYCTECDWYGNDNSELISEIVKLNLENNTL